MVCGLVPFACEPFATKKPRPLRARPQKWVAVDAANRPAKFTRASLAPPTYCGSGSGRGTRWDFAQAYGGLFHQPQSCTASFVSPSARSSAAGQTRLYPSEI
jgi:hypothetical protein